MGETTGISWCDHTWAPWMGCTEVSRGCDHCYARALLSERFGKVGWGQGAPRILTAPSGWLKPLLWDRAARRDGVRRRLFPSTMDPFDAEVRADWKARLFALIDATPNLDWLLLTKRPNRVAADLRATGREALPPNVWLGVSVESQAEAWRLEHLIETPATVRFVSAEPLLEPLDLVSDYLSLLDWVIVGAESGPDRRPFDNAWALSLVEQCDAAGVPVWCKQGPGLRSEAPFGDPRLDGRRELPRVAVAS